MTIHISSYPSIYNLNHKAIAQLLDGPIVVQEKIDGSQFSFGRDTGGTEPSMRSSGAEVYRGSDNKMFHKAIATVEAIWQADKLRLGNLYRGEYLTKPQHNTLAYTRTPKQHVILYDIDTSFGGQCYLGPAELMQGASDLGLETVPLIFEGTCPVTLPDLAAWLASRMPPESILGGEVEGLVIKNYHQLGPDKKILMAKYVTDKFREDHKLAWRKSNPTKTDVLARLTGELRTEARWLKAIRHLEDQNLLTGSAKDIGLLLKEVGQDTLKEEEEYIRDVLWKFYWPQLQRALTAGLPEWYKASLVSRDAI